MALPRGRPTIRDVVDDPRLPASDQLLGEPGRHLIASALDQLGARVERVTVRQAAYRPGRELLVRYSASVRWQGGALVEETVVAVTTIAGPPDGTLPVSSPAGTVGLWRWPHDPALPGLPIASTPSCVEELVGEQVGGVPALEILAYRPRRRAVVRATGPRGSVHLKVVRPDHVAPIADRHGRLRDRIRRPEVLATDDALGLVVLETLPGAPVRSALLSDTTGALPPETILELLGDLADLPDDGLGSVRSHVARLDGHARVLGAVAPSLADRVAALGEAVRALAGDGGPTQVIHGDLHDAQLLAPPAGGVHGVVDLDTVGVGEPVHDLGNLLAHLSALSIGRTPDQVRRIGEVRRRCRSAFASVVPVERLDATTAAALVGLATGPFSAQRDDWPELTEQTVRVAERWVSRETMNEGELIQAS